MGRPPPPRFRGCHAANDLLRFRDQEVGVRRRDRLPSLGVELTDKCLELLASHHLVAALKGPLRHLQLCRQALLHLRL